MEKSPLDIIAENLPTFLDLYNSRPEHIPSQMRLAKEANRIIAALTVAGFEIVRRS